MAKKCLFVIAVVLACTTSITVAATTDAASSSLGVSSENGGVTIETDAASGIEVFTIHDGDTVADGHGGGRSGVQEGVGHEAGIGGRCRGKW